VRRGYFIIDKVALVN
jgi:aminoacyl tRNA synthase complex-interacting multifunctional protein 1